MISIHIHRKIWIICILIALLGIAGCSYNEDQSRKYQDKLEEAVWKWEDAKKFASKVLGDYEQMDSVSFGRELLGALGRMEGAEEELSDLAEETEDQELRKNAKLCSKGMGEAYTAVREYGASLQWYLGIRELGSQEEIEEAQKTIADDYKKYLKDLKKGRKKIRDSEL